ncbi:MAG: hypothetical protein K8I60_20575 [Anaerolineae bacterium]|nr:hypothetical protein [Anaerolineae bacterium]
MNANGNPFALLYPDVLGSITGGKRISMDKLQCAVGVFPSKTYINQPIEVVLILQNMVDQNMQLKIGLQMPTVDKKGNPVVIDIPKKTLSVGIRAGEVGVLRIPIVPQPPTQPGTGYPVRIAIRYRTANEGRFVRPLAGGAPPSVLSVSPFKLQVLREVEFNSHIWNQSTDIITTYFDIAPKRIPPLNQDLQAHYESLWTHEELAEERELAQAKRQAALRVATGLTRASVYEPLRKAIDDRFAERGIPLHPGETMAIAKIMTYALDEGLELEPGFAMEEGRWFQTLCQVLAHNEDVEDLERGDLAVKYLFAAALYDAILLGFSVIQPKVREDLGDRSERVNYANRVLGWLAGQIEGDLSFVYLPLVLAGVVVNQIVTNRGDNPWVLLDELTEARGGRERLVSGEAQAIFHMLDDLLADGTDSLRRSRVPRP